MTSTSVFTPANVKKGACCKDRRMDLGGFSERLEPRTSRDARTSKRRKASLLSEASCMRAMIS